MIFLKNMYTKQITLFLIYSLTKSFVSHTFIMNNIKIVDIILKKNIVLAKENLFLKQTLKFIYFH